MADTCRSCGHRASRHWLPGGCHGTSGSNASACRCAFTAVRDERERDEGFLNERGALHVRPRTSTPAVDREALIAVLHEAHCTAYKHEGRNGKCEQEARTILASGVLTDAADVRRAVAAEIAQRIKNEIDGADRLRGYDLGHDDGLRLATCIADDAREAGGRDGD